MKKITGVALMFVSASLPVSAFADPLDQVGFEGGTFGGWLSVGTTSIEADDSLSLGGSLFELGANGQYMVKISPDGSSTQKAGVETLLGLTAGTFDGLGFAGTSNMTNFGLIYQSLTLDAGEYSFGWSYAATDYTPYDDGVFFAIAGNGVNDVSILASNATGQTDTLIVGSYGSTPWQEQTFTIATAGTYMLAFGGYNALDTGLSPILYIDNGLGSLLQDGVAVGPIAAVIDGSQSSFSFADLSGGSVLPTFDGGTLDVSGTQTYSNDLTFNSGGGTINTAAGSGFLLTGGLQGTGGLTKTGAGSLTIAGDNSGFTQGLNAQGGQTTITGTYGGGVTVAQGSTVQLGQGSAPGFVAGTIENSGDVVLGFEGNSLNYSVLNGTGDYIKRGAGEARLFGSGNASGNIVVEEGNLYANGDFRDAVMQIQSGARGGGIGAIGGFIVYTGATAAPGASIGTLTVDGDGLFEVDSHMEVETSGSGAADLIQLSGQIIIEGGQVHILTDDVEYQPVTEYTIMTAAGGVTGRFAGVDADQDNLTPYLSYTANAIRLALVRDDYRFSNDAMTGNQYRTAEGIQALGYGNPVWDAIAALDPAARAEAFTTLSGEIHASVPTGLLDTAQRVRFAVEDRMAGDTDGKHAWVQLINSTGKDKGSLEAGTGEHVMDGVVLGYDGTIGGSTLLGFALGRSDTDYDVDSRHSEATLTTTHVMAYGGHRFGDLRASAGVGYDFADVKTRRHVVAGSIDENLTAQYDSTLLQAMGEISYDMNVRGIALAPFVNIAAIDYRIDRFNEAGGDAAVYGNSAKDTREYGTLGVRASELAFGPAEFNTLIGWQYAAGDDLNEARAMRISWPNDAYAIRGVSAEQNSLRLEGDMSVAVGERGKLGLSYGGLFGDKSSDQSVQLEFTLAL